MKKFENKICVVVGGASGMGNATALKFHNEGGLVYILDIKNPESIKPYIKYLPCDVTDPGVCKNAIEQISNEQGKIDALFITAGKNFIGTIEDTDEKALKDLFTLNFFGTFYILKYVLPIMKKNKSGSIVLMGSDQSKIGKKKQAVYGATKAAIAQLTKSTAIDYAKYNIRINCVCPGTIDTPMFQAALDSIVTNTGSKIEEMKEAFAKAQPINRIGTPEEIANAVIFLCSDEASFITGIELSVDGGYTAQ